MATDSEMRLQILLTSIHCFLCNSSCYFCYKKRSHWGKSTDDSKLITAIDLLEEWSKIHDFDWKNYGKWEGKN